MTGGELAIRSVVASWLDASKRGDVQGVLDLMTDDALFLVPGQPPMDRSAFAAASRSQASAGLQIDARSEIQEVRVEGTVAYMWSRLAVTVVAEPNSEPVRRSGHTLTIFRKVDGRWLLCRDANMLVKI